MSMAVLHKASNGLFSPFSGSAPLGECILGTLTTPALVWVKSMQTRNPYTREGKPQILGVVGTSLIIGRNR